VPADGAVYRKKQGAGQEYHAPDPLWVRQHHRNHLSYVNTAPGWPISGVPRGPLAA
jgi:hypothetical protein